MRFIILIALVFSLFFNLVAVPSPAKAEDSNPDDEFQAELAQPFQPGAPLELVNRLQELQKQRTALLDQQKELQKQDEELKNKENNCCKNSIEKVQLQKDRDNLENKKPSLAESIEKSEQEIKKVILQIGGFKEAELVRAATNWQEYKSNLYDRLGWGGVYSDCTWYAAEAVKLASSGHIDLNVMDSGFGNWGNAGGWAWGAKNYAKNNPGGLIDSVDKYPRSGDVIEWPGHVAFVEQVQEIRDADSKLLSYVLSISEEAADGQGRVRVSTRVKLNDPTGLVRRFRSIMEFKANEAGVEANVKFIHFNYDVNWYR